jgi:hypothetical protein
MPSSSRVVAALPARTATPFEIVRLRRTVERERYAKGVRQLEDDWPRGALQL